VSDGSPARDPRSADGSPIPEGLDATLVLVRHGESEWIREGRFQGQAETPLSELGLRQAALAGERLARPHASPAMPVPGGRPVEIVHSPLARTAATASAVADAIARMAGPSDAPVPVRPEPGLLELCQGDWEGVTQDEIARRWPLELSAWRHRPWESVAPGGESLAEVQARVRPALARVLERLGRDYPRGTFDRPQVGGYAGVGGGHDQPWSVLVGHDGVFKVVMLTLFGLPLTQFWMFSLGLTGMSVVEFRGGRPVLRAHNLTAHLAPLDDEQAREAAERRARSGAF
jgi:phosphoserine phosphatase